MSDYYVSTAGSGSQPGSQVSPWLTLAHAAVNIVDGDTVHAGDGTYTLTTSLQILIGGFDDNHHTVFVSDNRFGAKLVNNIAVTDSSSDATVQINADYV